MQHAMKHIQQILFNQSRKNRHIRFQRIWICASAFCYATIRGLRHLQILKAGFIWEVYGSSFLPATIIMQATENSIPASVQQGFIKGRKIIWTSLIKDLKYADRYRVLMNQPGLHHWDFAIEGRMSTSVIHIRGDKEPGIRACYELANLYLLQLFQCSVER